ncbi:MAG: DUF359 domain-containing protein [Candidatus Lokiarchaeota archaeon]|nr:DUF359 domain-containing protein [Candidatus Lokiarchaeota archaeon]
MPIIDPNYIYTITEEARKLLAKPIGNLLVGNIQENIKKVPDYFKSQNDPNANHQIICVGDVVSEAFINEDAINSHLKMCVVDGKTERDEYKFRNINPVPNRLFMKNPAGTISGNVAHEFIRLLESDKKYFIMIDGEEDLLVIPIALYAQPNTFIIYGQPPVTSLGNDIPSGLVILKVNEDIKRKINSIFTLFEKKLAL